MDIKSGVLTLILLVLALNFISGAVYINEVELNPNGADSGDEWIELYNDGSVVNLSGWTLKNNNDDLYFLDSVNLGNQQFYVLDDLEGLDNTDESLTLLTPVNFSMDTTGLISDNDDDSETLQRIPDGSNDFNLTSHTKGNPNEQIEISEFSINPSCVLAQDTINLFSKVSCSCLDDVIFSVKDKNDVWINFTGVIANDHNYTAQIESNLFNDGSNAEWKAIALDKFGRVVESPVQNFYVNKKTGLTVSPSNPNGFNEWYISEPLFIIFNSDAYTKHYRWNGNLFDYIGSFGLEGAPNNGNVTGGIHVLNYWSNFSCGRIENQQNRTFKFDFSSPQIIDNEPTGQISDHSPLISAYIDELYQSNSGVNLSNTKMYINDEEVDADVNSSGALDAKISYQTSNLDDGSYEVKVSSSDKSGRESQETWNFEIYTPAVLNLNVINPNESVYGERKIPFIVTTQDIADEIGYYEFVEGKSSRKRKLCNDCDSYGDIDEKRISFSEGNHNLSFYAFTNDLNEEFNLSFLIDSKEPKIKKTTPKNSYVDGIFTVEFEEVNPRMLTLFYGNFTDSFGEDFDLSSCTKKDDSKYNCSKFINLDFFDGEEIKYYFVLKDVVYNEDTSKIIFVKVDSTNPILVNNDSFYDQDINIINFNLSVIEENFDLASYRYIDSRGNLREKNICTKLKDSMCKKKVSFRSGSWSLIVKIQDEAGNFVEYPVNFIVP